MGKLSTFQKTNCLLVHAFISKAQKLEVFIWKNGKIKIVSSTYLFLNGLQFLPSHKNFGKTSYVILSCEEREH
jgi:hypothetical protein